MYRKAGAELCSKQDLFERAELIVKVKEPIRDEYPLMREGQALFTYLHLAPNRELVDLLMQRKVAELVERGELAKAVYGMTEGQDLVSTAQALRSKFKARGWITFQAIGTGGSGDILGGDIGSPLVWLAGKGTQVTINGNGARLNVS